MLCRGDAGAHLRARSRLGIVFLSAARLVRTSAGLPSALRRRVTVEADRFEQAVL